MYINWRHLKVKNQLFVIYVLAILLPMLIIGSYLMAHTSHLILSHHMDLLESDNLRIRNILFDVTTSVINTADDISNDSQLQTLLSSSYDSYEEAHDALRHYEQFESVLKRYTQIEDIHLFTTNPDLHAYKFIYPLSQDIKKETWYTDYKDAIGYQWRVYSIEKGIDTVESRLQLVYPMPVYRSEYKAYLLLTVSNNYLKSRMDNNDFFSDICLNQGKIFFSTDNNEGMLQRIPLTEKKGIYNYKSKNTLIQMTMFTPIQSQDVFYILSGDPQALSDRQNFIWINSLIIGLSIVIPAIILGLFTTSFTSRIDKLRHGMHQVRLGNYDLEDKIVGEDELAQLFMDLKEMITSIKHRDQEIFQEKMAKQALIATSRQMEMKLLYSKINPHFLFNTLETIRMEAVAVDDKIVADNVKLLGKYLRYNLDKADQETLLSKELNYMEIYLKIQQHRFGEKINYEFAVDSSINPKKCLILPLLIQPIIENAILHGLEEGTQKGYLLMDINSEEGELIIRIEDNGRGIEKEKLKILNQHLTSKEASDRPLHLGMINVQERIQLFYGEAYGLYIESSLDEGTCVTIKLPQLSMGGKKLC